MEYHNNFILENLSYLGEEGLVHFERFKDIPNLEGLYQVSDLGRVKSLNFNKTKTEKIMKPSIDRYGYLYIELKRVKYKVHRLVALTFITNSDNKPTVNHKNENKLENIFTNLEWATVSEQNKYSKGISLNILVGDTLMNFKSLREAGKFFKCDKSTIKKRYC